MSLAISIATHNRVPDLRRTLDAIRGLCPAPDEIIVCADGCTDDTAEVVRRDYPEVTLLENKVSAGSIGSRDRIMRVAKSDLVLSLDDDSYPVEPDFIAKVEDLFRREKDVAVAYFPQRSDEFPESLTATDFGSQKEIGSFANSGAVFRRSTYLQLQGYPTFFFHAYEEPDYALQVFAAGERVIYFPELTIRHHYSGLQRNEIRTHQRHARNEFWSTLMRCPLPYMPFVAGYRMLSQMRYAMSRGSDWVVREPMWWWQGLKGAPYALKQRRPVPWSSYRNWLRLLRN